MAQGSRLKAQAIFPYNLIQRVKHLFIRTFTGNNVSLQNIIRGEYKNGNRIKAVFGDDPEIEIVHDDMIDAQSTLHIKVNDSAKAAAIQQLLPIKYEMGNLTLNISVENVAELSSNTILAASIVHFVARG